MRTKIVCARPCAARVCAWWGHGVVLVAVGCVVQFEFLQVRYCHRPTANCGMERLRGSCKCSCFWLVSRFAFCESRNEALPKRNECLAIRWHLTFPFPYPHRITQTQHKRNFAYRNVFHMHDIVCCARQRAKSKRREREREKIFALVRCNSILHDVDDDDK